MVTNQEVQEKFGEFLNGEAVEWQLLKMFFHQNGGFSRKAMDDDGEIDSAIGFSRTDHEIVVCMMSMEEDGDKYMAQEENTFRVAVDEQIKHRMSAMMEMALDHNAPTGFDTDKTDDLKDEMYR